MRNRLALIVLILIMVCGCIPDSNTKPATDTQMTLTKIYPRWENGVKHGVPILRVVDWQAGVVCYHYGNSIHGGMGCVPIADTFASWRLSEQPD